MSPAPAGGGAGPTPAGRASDRLWPKVVVGWLLACMVLLAVNIPLIAGPAFHDPDDVMRLLQLRDLFAGQSWWDVAQHRLGGARHAPFAMHWTRLVDIPLAIVAAPLSPLLGVDRALHVAAVVVPLLILLLVTALAASITRRLAGNEAATTAILVVPVTASLVAQMQPMRIDHHGWQIVCALAATRALLATPDRRSGLIAGAALAALLTVSLEGLPFAVAAAGVAVLAWVLRPERGRQARWTGLALFAVTLALHVAMRGPNALATACDAVAPAWIVALAVAAAGIAAITMFAPSRMAMRLALAAGVAALAGAALALIDPACAAGPFGRLDPLTRGMWFDHVPEGLPIWRQEPLPIIITFALPLIGGGATLRAWWRSSGDQRTAWAMLLVLLAAATLAALAVLRAGGTANALAVPGAATLVAAALARARAVPAVGTRTLAIAGALLLAAPGAVGSALYLAIAPTARGDLARGTPANQCVDGREVAALAALSPARVFAPLDVSPLILLHTPHSAIASGYHRNVAAMHDVIAAYTGTPDDARRIIAGSGARYLLVCPGLDEPRLYARTAPRGLLARLERGERFPWLTPVALPGNALRLWRIDPARR